MTTERQQDVAPAIAMIAPSEAGHPLSDFGRDQRSASCLCDAEPDVFAVFTFAVLALHRRCKKRGIEVCSCGQRADLCPVQMLADGLLFQPMEPAEPSEVRR